MVTVYCKNCSKSCNVCIAVGFCGQKWQPLFKMTTWHISRMTAAFQYRQTVCLLLINILCCFLEAWRSEAKPRQTTSGFKIALNLTLSPTSAELINCTTAYRKRYLYTVQLYRFWIPRTNLPISSIIARGTQKVTALGKIYEANPHVLQTMPDTNNGRVPSWKRFYRCQQGHTTKFTISVSIWGTEESFRTSLMTSVDEQIWQNHNTIWKWSIGWPRHAV